MRLVEIFAELKGYMGRIFEGRTFQFSPDGYHADDYLEMLLRQIEQRRKEEPAFKDWLMGVGIAAANQIDYSNKLSQGSPRDWED